MGCARCSTELCSFHDHSLNHKCSLYALFCMSIPRMEQNFFKNSRPEIRTARNCWAAVSHVSPDCLTGCRALTVLAGPEDRPGERKGYSVSSASRPSAAASSWPGPPPARGGRAGSPSAPRRAARHRSASGAGWCNGLARPSLQQREELQCCPVEAGPQAGGFSRMG